MTDLVGAVDEVSCLAEEGVDAGGNDDRLDLTLLAGRAGENFVSGMLRYRQRFTCVFEAGESAVVCTNRLQ